MSGAPIRIGTNQLPNPPIIIGITIKKIIMKAWAVTTTLYNWLFPFKNWLPGEANSKRIITESNVPITPEKTPKIKYNVPISLWLVEQNHLKIKLFILINENGGLVGTTTIQKMQLEF